MQNNDLQFHLKARAGDVGRYCLLPGDPARCAKIAQYFDNAKLISQNREFTIYTGTLSGEKVSAVSTGIGGPSAAICVEELVNIGADTLIRVGTSGGIDLKVSAGDLVIAQSAVRQDGTSLEYAPIEYPATADFNVTLALKKAAESLKFSYHIGVVQAKDSFYGQHSPQSMPTSPKLLTQWEAYKKLGVLASEMESAAIFTVAAVRRIRAGAVFATLWNQEREAAGLDQDENFDTTSAIRCAVEAVKILIAQDKSR